MLKRRKKVSKSKKIDRYVRLSAQYLLYKPKAVRSAKAHSIYVGFNGLETDLKCGEDGSVTTWDLCRGNQRLIIIFDEDNPDVVNCGEWIAEHKSYLMQKVQARFTSNYLNILLSEKVKVSETEKVVT